MGNAGFTGPIYTLPESGFMKVLWVEMRGIDTDVIKTPTAW